MPLINLQASFTQRGEGHQQCLIAGQKERHDTGGISTTHSSALLHPSSHEGPKGKGWGQGYLLLHNLLLCGHARGWLLTLCKGHNTKSSCSSQQTDAWKCRPEQGRPWVWGCTAQLKGGCRETAAKANKVPPARRHLRHTCQALQL